jgi:hypothetical protein
MPSLRNPFRRKDRVDTGPSPGADPRSVYAAMRQIVLSLDPAEHALQPTTELPNVYAAIFDVGLAGGAVTIACVADGTTSMYTSSGGGVIGAGAHVAAREANRRLLVEIERHLDAFGGTTDAPLPGPDRVALVACTHGGLRRLEGSQPDVYRDAAPAAPAFIAAQEVITAIRLLDAAPEPG